MVMPLSFSFLYICSASELQGLGNQRFYRIRRFSPLLPLPVHRSENVAGIDNILPADEFAVAAKFVFIYSFAQARLHRILMNIPKHGKQIFLAVYRFHLISVLKQMSFSVVLDVVPVHKAAADLAEDLIEPFPFLFDQKMDMIAHQTIRIQLKAADELYVIESRQEFFIILPVFKNLLTVDSPKHSMIDSALTLFGCSRNITSLVFIVHILILTVNGISHKNCPSDIHLVYDVIYPFLFPISMILPNYAIYLTSH